LGAWAFEPPLTSADVLAYLRSLPPADVPRVAVLDNASLHVRQRFKAERQALAREGI
jgi:hypothetical protein